MASTSPVFKTTHPKNFILKDINSDKTLQLDSIPGASLAQRPKFQNKR